MRLQNDMSDYPIIYIMANYIKAEFCLSSQHAGFWMLALLPEIACHQVK